MWNGCSCPPPLKLIFMAGSLSEAGTDAVVKCPTKGKINRKRGGQECVRSHTDLLFLVFDELAEVRAQAAGLPVLLASRQRFVNLFVSVSQVQVRFRQLRINQ